MVEASAYLQSHGATTHDEKTGEVASEVRRLISHFTFHLDRARNVVTAIDFLVKRFDEACGKLEVLLGDAAPKSLVATAVPRVDVPAEPKKRKAASSFQDFEPRSSMRD